MSRCSHPIYALDRGLKDNGKRNIKILPRRVDLYSYEQLTARYGKGSILTIPCGKCLACKLNKSKEWAVRCCLEASLYDENWFVTLTYDDEHLPSDYSLHRKDVQDFLKRLRHVAPGLRYFGCGEYGTSNGGTHRPHYHLILFNCHLSDVQSICKGSYGGYYYESKSLEKTWSLGQVMLGDVSYSSASYVARYATKKLFSNSVHKDEFICMSTKPGLGFGWLMKHFDCFDDDSIFGDFGTSKCSKIPRYFEKVADYVALDLQEIKDQRICKMEPINLHELNVHGFDSFEKLYKYNGDILKREFDEKKRRKDL